MTRGIDTTFLVQVEVLEHPSHKAAKDKLNQVLDADEGLALAAQVLFEFVHIVTDPRRFSEPLTMDRALSRARRWWAAQEVVHAFPTSDSVALGHQWLEKHGLGRKRILDTHLAATYYSNGIVSILSSNARDYGVFGCFEVVTP